MSSLLSEIETFIAAHGLAETTFGARAMGDKHLVKQLRGEGRRRPRRVWPETEAKVRNFMLTYAPDREAEC